MTPTDETKQTENGSAYLLTEAERGVLQTLHMGVVSAKAVVYDAQNALVAAQHAFEAGLGFLANSHSLGGGTLTPDFAAIIRGSVDPTPAPGDKPTKATP